jgi:hypothetical protein
MGARDAIAPAACVVLLSALLVAAPAPPAAGGLQMAATTTVPDGEPDVRRRPRPRVVPPGPASPTSPTIDSYYYQLQHGNCAALRVRTTGSTNPEDVLFAALADLCLAAAQSSYRADWTAAQDALTGSATLDDCLSVAARRSLANALSNHQRTGRQRPDFRPTPRVSTCVPQPTYIGLYQQSDSGPLTLLVLGLRLFEAATVSIADARLDATSSNVVEGTECARVDVPGWTPPPEGATATVVIRGRGYTTASFTGTVGPVLTADDISNLDTTACRPAV